VTATGATSATYTAICAREGRWWIVNVPELASGGVTQARSLDEVPAVVADLVATMTGADRASVEVEMQVHAGPETTKRGGFSSLRAVVSGAMHRLSGAA
jgi:hypothetical protein